MNIQQIFVWILAQWPMSSEVIKCRLHSALLGSPLHVNLLFPIWWQDTLLNSVLLVKQRYLTYWGRVCIDNLSTIGSHDGLSPSWPQAIIWTNAWMTSLDRWKQTSVKIWSKLLNVIPENACESVVREMAAIFVSVSIYWKRQSPVSGTLPTS